MNASNVYFTIENVQFIPFIECRESSLYLDNVELTKRIDVIGLLEMRKL